MIPPAQYRVLVADDEEGLRFVLSQLLRHEGCEVVTACDGEDALKKAASQQFDLYICDMKMPKVEGMDVLKQIRRRSPDALVVMMTAFGSQKLAIDALRAGAYDYFTKPFEMDELRVVLRRALEKQALLRKVESLEKQLGGHAGFHRIIAQGEKMQRVFDLIRRVSGHDITVLITGESGVGKELVAEAIHETGVGAEKPFVKVNCAAIPEPLLESELFGHEKGAFTGAIASKPGKFEIADGGSILLDEIGEMPLGLQAKLLRVLQEKKVERVGDNRSRSINVRIMTATNRDLLQMVKEKTFREDLYFRINVLPIFVPPLRERIEDLPALIDHFLLKYNRRNGKAVMGVTPEALAVFEAYRWPGNIRELENTIQRAMIMTSGSVIDLASLPPGIARVDAAACATDEDENLKQAHDAFHAFEDVLVGPLAGQIEKMVEREEKRLILAALKKMNHRRQETADLLGISRKSLHNKMQKYGLFETEAEDRQ